MTRPGLFVLHVVLGLVWLSGRDAVAASPDPERRVAVVVGANAGFSGGPPLRYAHRDAVRMAETLRDVGGFRAEDTHLLLDPRPQDLLAVLDAELRQADAGRTLLLFYYSGHADDQALYPRGERLPFEAVRSRIEDERAAVRVGIVDACRGGRWTGTKGLAPEPPFEVPLLTALESTGSVLIASSSGAQSAHENESIEGSLFTHHLVAGLRGGADEGGDGAITLAEAFDYAKAGTVRDAVLYAGGDQHPSFHVNLRGRQELVLSRVASSASLVEVQQATGPLELVDLASGVTLLTLQPGTRVTRLALVPGRYLLVRHAADGRYAAEFRLGPDERLVVTEDQLELVGSLALVRKGPIPRSLPPLVLPARHAETRALSGATLDDLSFGAMRLVLGSEPLDAGGGLDLRTEAGVALSLGDRVDLLLPGVLRVALGPEGRTVAWGGLRSVSAWTSLAAEDVDGRFTPGASVGIGLDGQLPLASPRPYAAGALIGGLAGGSLGQDVWPVGSDRYRVDAYGGFRAIVKRLYVNGAFTAGAEFGVGPARFVGGLGSVAMPGGVRLPTLGVILDDDLGTSLDFYQGSVFGFGDDTSNWLFMVGLTTRSSTERDPAAAGGRVRGR